MNDYVVVWEIAISADTPREAAERAREYPLDPNSTATVFTVREFGSSPVDIDLLDDVERTD